jgi:malate dehydrogenase (oxaloacetate-decarboxylating)
MLLATSAALAEASPLAATGQGELLPALGEIAQLSKKIAFDVAKIAMQQNLALEVSDEILKERIERNFWMPEYRPYKRVSI